MSTTATTTLGRFNVMVVIKAWRAVGWGIGLVMLFVQPMIGLLILIAALAATVYLARNNS